MTEIPEAAIDAGRAAYNQTWLTSNRSNPRFGKNVVSAILKAAAPHIAAAERERIRQLAIEHGANAKVAADNSAGYRWIMFADLLADPEGTTP